MSQRSRPYVREGARSSMNRGQHFVRNRMLLVDKLLQNWFFFTLIQCAQALGSEKPIDDFHHRRLRRGLEHEHRVDAVVRLRREESLVNPADDWDGKN